MCQPDLSGSLIIQPFTLICSQAACDLESTQTAKALQQGFSLPGILFPWVTGKQQLAEQFYI
jgi:hypothetical protein